MAFIFGVIRSISALSFVIDASNSASVSPEESCAVSVNFIRFGRGSARGLAYLALFPAENLKVHFDSVIVYALRVLRRAILCILILINVHSDLVA
jgi:hypothetical protein